MCFWSCTAKKIGTFGTQPPTKRVDMVFKHIISQMIKGHTQLVGGFKPLWKIWVKLGIFPKFRGENKKHLWHHHPDNHKLAKNLFRPISKQLTFESNQNVGLFETGLTSNKKHTHCYLLHLPYIAAKKSPLSNPFLRRSQKVVGHRSVNSDECCLQQSVRGSECSPTKRSCLTIKISRMNFVVFQPPSNVPSKERTSGGTKKNTQQYPTV